MRHGGYVVLGTLEEPMPPTLKNKDYKVAYLLVMFGVAIMLFERFGMKGLRDQGIRFDPNLVGVLAVAPFILIFAGAVAFMVKRMQKRGKPE